MHPVVTRRICASRTRPGLLTRTQMGSRKQECGEQLKWEHEFMGGYDLRKESGQDRQCFFHLVS